MCLDLFALCSFSLIALSCRRGVSGLLAFYLGLTTDRLTPGINCKSNALSSLVQCLVREIITTTERKLYLFLPPPSLSLFISPLSSFLSSVSSPSLHLFSRNDLPSALSSSRQLSSLHFFNNTFPMIREN